MGVMLSTTDDAALRYPPADRDDTVEVLHGTRFADPYRYLEDPDAARTIAFVDAAASSPFVQLSMVPLLTLTAYYAPPGHRATWFALMASLMNLALVAGSVAGSTGCIHNHYYGQLPACATEAGAVTVEKPRHRLAGRHPGRDGGGPEPGQGLPASQLHRRRLPMPKAPAGHSTPARDAAP